MRSLRKTSQLALIAIASLMAACATPGDEAVPQQMEEEAHGEIEAPASTAETAEGDQPIEYVGSVEIDPPHGPAGTKARLSGAALPASETFDVMWSTADCLWDIQGEANEEYHGRVCTEKEVLLGTAVSDAGGGLRTSFEVPEDYGFAHDVVLVDGTGVVRNKASFTLDMEVVVTPTRGPAGTPITIEVRGMGWQTLENNRTILYDNQYVGWMSSVTTKGTARAVIPAVGPPGRHVIQVARGAYTFPYLNPAQSPRPDIPVFEETFTVTRGDAVLPLPIGQQNPNAETTEVKLTDPEGPAIGTNLVSGPVGTEFLIVGAGFDPGAEVTLHWYRIVGNRVSGQGWDEQSVSLGTVEVDDEGSFEFGTEVPRDVGGPHRIEAIVEATTVAQTAVTITPAAGKLGRTSGPWGTELAVRLTGVGWTETANIYTLVYDNAYLGYACGFNSQGDVTIPLRATGEPGWHFIDLYPAIYKGEETPGQQSFRIPQLTFAEDHPGEDLPAFHFAFLITE